MGGQATSSETTSNTCDVVRALSVATHSPMMDRRHVWSHPVTTDGRLPGQCHGTIRGARVSPSSMRNQRPQPYVRMNGLPVIRAHRQRPHHSHCWGGGELGTVFHRRERGPRRISVSGGGQRHRRSVAMWVRAARLLGHFRGPGSRPVHVRTSNGRDQSRGRSRTVGKQVETHSRSSGSTVREGFEKTRAETTAVPDAGVEE